jgi:hypothetical protein
MTGNISPRGAPGEKPDIIVDVNPEDPAIEIRRYEEAIVTHRQEGGG